MCRSTSRSRQQSRAVLPRKQSRPYPRDLRAALEALDAVRASRHDPNAWPDALIDAIRDLLPARVCILGVSSDFHPGTKSATILLVRRGWTSPEQERVWLEYAKVPVTRTPEYNALVTFTGPQITRSRDQLWPRDVWYRSRTYNEIHKPAGIDDSIISIARHATRPLTLSIWAHRAPGDADFTRREWWLLHVITGHAAAMLDDILALPRDELEALTPRQRQTLDRLLAGDSEKQVALALGIKRSTVHEHVLAIYRALEVSSRAELLARFVGRPLPMLDDPTV